MQQENVNEQIKSEVIARLKQLLVKQESGDKFIYYGQEAGTGKTLEMNSIIADGIANGGNRNYLIVVKYVSAVIETVNRINSQFPYVVATGIDYENWSDFRDTLSMLPHCPVLVITHKRYLNLALNPELRTYFEKNRHTLIIDEFMEPPIYTFSETKHSQIIKYLKSPHLRKDLDELYVQFYDVTTIRHNDKITTCTPKVNSEQLNVFRGKIKANWNVVDKPTEIMEYLDTLEILSKTVCYHNGDRISGLDPRLKLWTLRNNIILDANAGIDRRGNYAPNFIVNVQPKIHHYADSIIRVAPINSSKSAKKGYVDFHNQVALAVHSWRSDGSKTLIICSQNEEEDLIESLYKNGFDNISVGDSFNGEDLAIDHFYNILGKNHWRDFNQVWVIASPNLNMDLYPLYRDFFSGLPTQLETVIRMTRNKDGYGYVDPELEAIRIGCIAGEIYQAIKRVDRKNEHGAEIFLITKSPGVVNKIVKNLPGIQIGEPLELGIKPKDAAPKELETKARQLADLIIGLPPREYTKKYLRERLSWTNSSNFGLYFNHKYVQDLIPTIFIPVPDNNRKIRRLPNAYSQAAK